MRLGYFLGTTMLQPVRSAAVPAPTFIQPYNAHFILGPGDSRTAMAGGLSGTYGTGSGITDSWEGSSSVGYDSYIAMMLGHVIRGGSAPNPGIGGQTAAYALAYPRPLGATPFTARIDNGTVGQPGNILTVTTIGGGALPILAGCVVTPPGGTACVIQPLGTGGTTGTGTTGTYAVDGPAQSIASTSSMQIGYVAGQAPKKTIADIAAHEAAIIVLGPLGTNGVGATGELTAMDQAIRGLTDPTYSYPGYGAPLPLYGGNPKTIILINETRRGITTANAVNQESTNPAQFANYARTLKRYSFDSGDPTYANPHVIVVDVFDDPTFADLTDTTTFHPLPGLVADGLHPAAPASFRAAKIIANRIGPLLSTGKQYAQLPTTDTAASYYSSNPCFTTTSGGTSSIGSHTLTGTVPSGWRLLMSAGSGLTVDISYNALGGNLGNEVVIHVTGTASADCKVQFDQLSTAGQRGGINLATDTIRSIANVRHTVAAGQCYLAEWYTLLQLDTTANRMLSQVGASGSKLGYGNNAAYPLWVKNDYADINTSTALTYMSKNLSLAPYGATGTPGTMEMVFNMQFVAGVAVDATLRISQAGIFKVTD